MTAAVALATADMIRELARAQALFQLRTIALVMDVSPDLVVAHADGFRLTTQPHQHPAEQDGERGREGVGFIHNGGIGA
jgi:hypothetical protein